MSSTSALIATGLDPHGVCYLIGSEDAANLIVAKSMACKIESL